jgi:hypothetical protein
VWTGEVDEILAGDLVAAMAYLTPAGGAVVVPVCPLGLHDRDQGRVGFTTSTGYGRKLDRIAADGRVAMAFHTRTHGHSGRPGFVLVQGEACIDTTSTALARAAAQAPLYLGRLSRGWFWDRWLRVYYQDRVVVWIRARRITVRAADGTLRQVIGEPVPDAAPPVQTPPRKGNGPRVDARRAGRRVTEEPNRLLAYRDADGYPTIVPVDVLAADPDGLTLRPAWPLPSGDRRAGLLAHSFGPEVVGLAQRLYTGWLVCGDVVRYAPQTARAINLPPNRTLTLMVNGLVARRRTPRGTSGRSALSRQEPAGESGSARQEMARSSGKRAS